tara:strand:+ start:783 stop:1226 length:444 start_codon:yes stop_codon:yes gene_type:complete
MNNIGSFQDYVATTHARKQKELNILKYVSQLMLALEDNYRKYAIIQAEKCVKQGSQYHMERLVKLRAGLAEMTYVLETGRKYHKIIMVDNAGSRSVHAFVDKKTGEVYKAASFKAPAKGVRFNVCVITEREWLLEHADWAGGYLYKR